MRCTENLITSVISLVKVINAATVSMAIPSFLVPNFLYKIKSKIRKNGIQFNCLVTNNHISSNGLEPKLLRNINNFIII